MSLAGRGVVLTRPRELAEPFARLLERRGAHAIVFPAIEIQPLAPPSSLARLRDYDLVVFISPSAVRIALATSPPWPPRLAAAVGAGTRRELERAGARANIAPPGAADSEALLAMRELQELAGKRVLIVRGEGGRGLLAESLAARGALVEHAVCYRRAKPAADAAPLVAAWRRGEVHALTVFSAQALDNFSAMGGAELIAALPIFVPHERIASHARERGAREALIAAGSDDEMLERLVAYFDGRD
jgi:uroporphyrinogen-III synthase